MVKSILSKKALERFSREIFDRDEEVKKIVPIIKGIFDARSPRLLGIAQAMPGNSDANYKGNPEIYPDT